MKDIRGKVVLHRPPPQTISTIGDSMLYISISHRTEQENSQNRSTQIQCAIGKDLCFFHTKLTDNPLAVALSYPPRFWRLNKPGQIRDKSRLNHFTEGCCLPSITAVLAIYCVYRPASNLITNPMESAPGSSPNAGVTESPCPQLLAVIDAPSSLSTVA